MYSILALCILGAALPALEAYPSHASCTVTWTFELGCEDVKTKIVNQIEEWKTADNCNDGGEKCLYKLLYNSRNQLNGTHTTPVHHYVDGIGFTLKPYANANCKVIGYSESTLKGAYLDYGTNYCNVHNLITGSELDKTPGYTETTNDNICTEYSKADCDKY